MAFASDDKTVLRIPQSSSSYQLPHQLQYQHQPTPMHHYSHQQQSLPLPVYAAQPMATSLSNTPLEHQFYDGSSTRMQQQSLEVELRQRLVVVMNELQREQEKCHQEVLKNKRTTEMYNRLCEKYHRATSDKDEAMHDYTQTMEERDDVLRKLEIAETSLDQCQAKCQRYEAQNREAQHAITTLRTEIQSAMKERDQFRLQCGEKDETIQKLRYNMLSGQSMQELEHLRAAVQRWQAERNVYCTERQELHEQVKNAQQGRQLAFDLRETAVKERESMSAMCNEMRRDRDEQIHKLADALRQLDELKRKQQEAVKRAANAQERVEVLQRDNCMLHYKQQILIQQQQQSPSHRNMSNPTDSSDSAISNSESGQTMLDAGKPNDEPVMHCQTKEIDVDLSSAKFEKFEDLGLNLTYVPAIPDNGAISAVYVHSIDANSPFRDELKPNDRIVRIDNNLVAGASIASVPAYIANQADEYKHVTFLVKRRIAPPQPVARVFDVVYRVPTSEGRLQLQTGTFVTHIDESPDENDDVQQQQQRLMVGDQIVAVDGYEIDVNRTNCEDAVKVVADQILSHAGSRITVRASRFVPSCDDAVAHRKRYILSNTVQYAEKSVQAGMDDSEEMADEHANNGSPVTPTNVDETVIHTDAVNLTASQQRCKMPNKFGSLPRNALPTGNARPALTSNANEKPQRYSDFAQTPSPTTSIEKAHAPQHVKHDSSASGQSSSSTATTKAVSDPVSSEKSQLFAPPTRNRYAADDRMAPFFSPSVDDNVEEAYNRDNAPIGLLPAKKSLFERVFGGGNVTISKHLRDNVDRGDCFDPSEQQHIGRIPSQNNDAAGTDRSKQRRHTMFYVTTPGGGGDGFRPFSQNDEEANGTQQVAEVDDALSALDDVIVQHAKTTTTTRKVVSDNLYDAPPTSRRRGGRPLTLSQFHSPPAQPSDHRTPSLAERYDDIMGRSGTTANHHHFFTTRRGQARKLAAAIRGVQPPLSPESLMGAGSKCDTSTIVGGVGGCHKPSILAKAKKFLRKVSDKVPGGNSSPAAHKPTTIGGSSRVKLRRGSYNDSHNNQSSSCDSSALIDDDYLYGNSSTSAGAVAGSNDGGTWPRERHMRALTAAFAIDTDSEAYAMAAAATNADDFHRQWQQQQQFMDNGNTRPFSVGGPLAWSEYITAVGTNSAYVNNPRSGPMSRKRMPILPPPTSAHTLPASPFLSAQEQQPQYSSHEAAFAAEQRARTLPRLPAGFSTPSTNHFSSFIPYNNNSSAVAAGAYTPISWMPPTRTVPPPLSSRLYSTGGISSSSSACREFQCVSGSTNNAVVAGYTMPQQKDEYFGQANFFQQPASDLHNSACHWSSAAVVDTPSSTHQRQFYEGLYDVLPSSSTAPVRAVGQPLYDVLPQQREAPQPESGGGDRRIPRMIPPRDGVGAGSLAIPSSMERIQQQVRKQKPPPAGIRTISIQRPAVSRRSSISTNTTAQAISNKSQVPPPLGIEVDEVELYTANGGSEKAVMIVNVAKDSPSDRAGLCVGDQLLDLNGLNLRSTNKPDLGIVRNILLIVTDGEETVNMKVQYRGADVLRSAITNMTTQNDPDGEKNGKQNSSTMKSVGRPANAVKNRSKTAKTPSSTNKHRHPPLSAVFSDSKTTVACAPAKPLRRGAAAPATKSSNASSSSNKLTPNSSALDEFAAAASSSTLPHLCPPKSDEDVRTVIVQKAQNENIGITLVGGNVLGIFVHTIASDSPVWRGQVISRMKTKRLDDADGETDDTHDLNLSDNSENLLLKPGDQILRYNNASLLQATAEQASLEVSKPASRIEFVVQHHPQRYALALERPGDAFHVRALFDYQGTSDEELSFRKGQVLLVDCTVWKGSVGRWRAWLLDERGEKKDYGLIPNRYRAEEAVVAQRHSRKQDSMDSNDSMTKRWSFFVRRKRSGQQQQQPSQAGNILAPSSSGASLTPQSNAENNADQLYSSGYGVASKNSVGKASKLFSSSTLNRTSTAAAREILSITFDDMTLTDSNDENNQQGDDDPITDRNNNSVNDAGAPACSGTSTSVATGSASTNKAHIFPTYQRVVRVDYAEKRPVVLIGPLSEQISNLLVEYPVFAHCPLEVLQSGDEMSAAEMLFDADDVVIEKRYRNSGGANNDKHQSNHVEAIMASVVRDICAKNYHCLLVPASENQTETIVQRLRQASFFPIVILVQFKSAKLLKEALTCVVASSPSPGSTSAALLNGSSTALTRHMAASGAILGTDSSNNRLPLMPSVSVASDFATKAALKETTSREVYDRSVQMEADLKDVITAVVRTTNFKFAVLQIKEVVDKEQRKALWIPYEDNGTDKL